MSAWLLLLALLYFVQGLPYGIQINLLPIILRTQGFSLTNISLLKLLFLPWVFKLLWAPHVDKRGTRKQWLMATLVLQATVCLLTASLPFSDVSTLALMLFLLNVCTSVLDISVDALAVDILSSDDVGMGNVAQVVGYKLGGVAAGALYMLLSHSIGHGAVYVILAAAYISTLLVVMPLNLGTKSTARKEVAFASSSQTIREALHIPGAMWMVVYTLFYKCGENGSIHMIPMFLLDNGIPDRKVAVCTGVIGSFMTIFGSISGGPILKRYSAYTTSHWLNPCRLVIITGVLASVQIWTWALSLHSSISNLLLLLACCQLFLSGLSTTVVFSWMMHLTQHAPARVQTTLYTTLATTEVLGKLFSSSLLGYVADSLGYVSTFLLLALALGAITMMTVNPPRILKLLGANAKT